MKNLLSHFSLLLLAGLPRTKEMMKKIYTVFSITLIVVLLVCTHEIGCFTPQEHWFDNQEVTFSASQLPAKLPSPAGVVLTFTSVSENGGTFWLRNDTSSSISFSYDNHLEKHIDGSWYTVEYQEPILDLEMSISPGKSAKQARSWPNINAGLYRYVMPIYLNNANTYVSVEFQIN